MPPVNSLEALDQIAEGKITQCSRKHTIGHYNYYGITGNYGALKNVYYAAIKFWRKALSSRSQSGRMNWEKYRKILKHYPVREPKIRLTYGRLKALALL